MAKKKCRQAAQAAHLGAPTRHQHQLRIEASSGMQKAEATTRAPREHHAKSREQHESTATEPRRHRPRRHRPDGARPGAASASEPKRRHKQQTKTPPKVELTAKCFCARRPRAERRKPMPAASCGVCSKTGQAGAGAKREGTISSGVPKRIL